MFEHVLKLEYFGTTLVNILNKAWSSTKVLSQAPCQINRNLAYFSQPLLLLWA